MRKKLQRQRKVRLGYVGFACSSTKDSDKMFLGRAESLSTEIRDFLLTSEAFHCGASIDCTADHAMRSMLHPLLAAKTLPKKSASSFRSIRYEIGFFSSGFLCIAEQTIAKSQYKIRIRNAVPSDGSLTAFLCASSIRYYIFSFPRFGFLLVRCCVNSALIVRSNFLCL